MLYLKKVLSWVTLMPFRKFYPLTAAEEIEKAILFIKARQYHAGFLEIPNPHFGGEIEVSIEADPNDPNVFHVIFKFMAIPSNQPIIQVAKEINYQELRTLAWQYDQDKEKIDGELSDQVKNRPVVKA